MQASDLKREINSGRHYFAWAMVITWFAAMVVAFWWFQFRDLRPFDEGKLTRTEFFTGTDLAEHLRPLMRKEVRATAVHFWDPGCECNRFNQVHVNDIMQEFAGRLIDFVVVVRVQREHEAQKLKARAREVFPHASVIEIQTDWPEQGQPPSSPAVAVADANGELAYFGPYSIGAVCSVGNGDFVEATLKKLLGGNNPRQVNILATGCFCPWQQGKPV